MNSRKRVYLLIMLAGIALLVAWSGVALALSATH